MSFGGQNLQHLDSTRDARIQDHPSSSGRDYPIYEADNKYQRRPLLPYGLDAVAEFTYGPDFWNKFSATNSGCVAAFSRPSLSATEQPLPTTAEGRPSTTDTSGQDQAQINQDTASVDYSYTDYGTEQQDQQDQPAIIYDRGGIPALDPEESGSDTPGESS